jgi:hypothetical protein
MVWSIQASSINTTSPSPSAMKLELLSVMVSTVGCAASMSQGDCFGGFVGQPEQMMLLLEGVHTFMEVFITTESMSQQIDHIKKISMYGAPHSLSVRGYPYPTATSRP